MVRRRRVEVSLTRTGALFALIGAYVPSIRPNPEQPPDTLLPDVLIPGASPGIGLLDLPFLAVAALLLVAHVLDVEEPHRAALAVGAGAIAVSIAILGVLGHPLVGFDGSYVPTTGWYLTTLGGGLLLGAGAVWAPELVAEYGVLGA